MINDNCVLLKKCVFVIIMADEQVVNGAVVLEVLHQLPQISSFLMSLYNCHYDQFFQSLGEYSSQMIGWAY